MLEALVEELGISEKLLDYRARQVWEQAVGPGLVQYARPLGVRRGRMEVAVPSAVWRQQLTFMKQEIIGKINELVGREVIKELILVNQP